MLGAPDLARLFRALYRIRRAEEEIARIYPSDLIKSPVHLSIGQEAVAVGVCDALRPDDVVFGTYRGHATYLAKGGDLAAMLAELYGKDTGCTRGKGGSMHLIDPDHGVMGTSAVVATTIPHAVGYAYAQRYRRTDRITVSFFGDGATEEGAYHESLNFAALKRLPVLFVCENNDFAIHSRLLARRSSHNIAEQAASYGLGAERIEDNDVLRIRERAVEAVAALRLGGGPRLLECMTYRWKEHVGPSDDFALGYRTPEEARPWIKSDQVARLGAMLDAAVRRTVEAEVEAELRQAIDFAERSPFPSGDELMSDVFTE
jgi:TPP-dependent pyruvate/acetoin dehydrogenase alpha subunit